MDYKRKYEEAFERASKLRVQNPFDTVSQMVEHIFPELKESEDERIRKGLIKAVSGTLKGNTLYGTDVTREEALAWLEKQSEKKNTRKREIDNAYLQGICDAKHEIEKQGEKVTNINGEDYGIDGLYHAIDILEKTIGRVGGYQSDDGILEHKAAINAVKELYKKQYAQKHFSDFKAEDWYVSKVDGKIHNMTYNPTDKVKPKFKVGD